MECYNRIFRVTVATYLVIEEKYYDEISESNYWVYDLLDVA